MTRLQQIREKKGLSQRQLSKQAKVQQAMISLVESRKARASREFAAAVATALAPDISEMQILYPERYPAELQEAVL